MWALIAAGQLFPEIPPQELFPYLNNEKLSEMAKALGRREINDLLHLLLLLLLLQTDTQSCVYFK
jgi:hypothetical protein